MYANWTKPFTDLNKLQEHVNTPMVAPNNLGPDLSGIAVNETRYRGFDLKGYSNSEYVGCNMDKKITSGVCQLLGGKQVDHNLKGDIELHFITTQYQLADIFTKPLDEPTFKRFIVELGGIRGDIGGYNSKMTKKTSEKVVPYPRFISLLLEYMMPEYDNKELTINPTQVFNVHNWALKLNQTEGPPFINHMKAIYNLDVPVHSKVPKPYSQTEEVLQGKKPGAKMVGEMHKEAQQAAGGPTSLGATSKEGAHPQLSNYSTTKADLGLSAPNDSIPAQQAWMKEPKTIKLITYLQGLIQVQMRSPELMTFLKIKLEDLLDLLKDIRSAFFTLDSPQDEPIIVSYESEEEEEVAKYKYTHASSYNILEYTSIPHLPSLKSAQIQELMAQDSLPSLLNKVTDTLNRFATVVENTSGATTKYVPSASQATAAPAEGEKNTNLATTYDKPNLHDELVDLLGLDVMTQYYNKKLLYDKYCDKMLKGKKSSKITNCDILTQKGPISLKVHREDRTNEVISNVKVSNLHLAEWREVVQE
nr:retrovirus-related Pol polyprotein from transposon TNT 1-94 [Tanacetum cinerariifolium]